MLVHRLLLCFLFFASSSIAQTKVDTSESAQPSPLQNQTKDSLFLRVQRPDQDTLKVFTSRYRIAACTNPDAQTFVNGEPIKVYPSGAVAGLIEVNVGKNILCYTVKSPSGDSLRKEFVLIRPEPLKTSSYDTLIIEDTLMEPSQDVWLILGDVLEVKFKGSPGCEASFDIPGVASGIPMRELTPQEANRLGGIYVGRYNIQATDKAHDEKIVFHLKKSFWSREKAYSKGFVSILTGELPRVAEVTGRLPYLNIGLGDDRLGGAKLGFLEPGVRVEITGKVGSSYRIRLSSIMEAWLPVEFAKFLQPDTPLPRSLTGSIAAVSNGSEDIVTLSLSKKLP